MHIKYRPKTFDEIIGNTVLIKSLKEDLDKNIIRPIMLEGITGGGKTSLSYIIANQWGGKNLNLREINCYQITGVAEARELIEEVTNISRHNLFNIKTCIILDETHALSEKALNVFLKPLEIENLNDNILYIACTTTVGKLSEPFLDRFQRYRVSPLSEKESLELLDRVCTGENISIPKWLQVLLIEKSEGIPRRLLTGLSKVKSVTEESEAKFLLDVNSIDESSEVLELFKMMLKGIDWRDIKKYLQVLLKDNSPESIRISLMNLIGGRLVSDYHKEEDSNKLILAYEVLRNNNNIPEKASLIVDILSSVLILRGV